MHCGQCNTALPETAAFCGNCGAKVTEQKCPEVSPNTTAGEPQQTPPPIPRSATVAQPQASPQNHYQSQQISMDESSQPVSVGAYFIMMMLFSIPLVNIIMMIIWAIGSKNKSKQNFAIAALIWFVLAIILCVIGSMAIGLLLSFSAMMIDSGEVIHYLEKMVENM